MSNTQYATVAELKAQINKTKTDADTDMQVLLNAAARRIDRHCRREDGAFVADSVASARVYIGLGQAFVRVDEYISASLVAAKDSATDTTYTDWETTDWLSARGDPRYPDFNHTPYTLLLTTGSGDYSVFTNGRLTTQRGFAPDLDSASSRGLPTVQVTAKWGYAETVPDDINMATIMLAARWFKRLESAMADATSSMEFGLLMYTKTLDPVIAGILESGRYIRRGR